MPNLAPWPPSSHPRLWPEPWLELISTAQGIQMLSVVMWPSDDNFIAMHHPGHVISRKPPCQPSWDLGVPTLIFTLSFSILLADTSLIAPQRLHAYLLSFPTWALLYAPLFHVHAFIPFHPMQTAAIVTDTFWPPF